jgi:hypothetical protein
MCEVSRVCRIDEVFFSARPSAALVLSLLRFVNMLLSVCCCFHSLGLDFATRKGEGMAIGDGDDIVSVKAYKSILYVLKALD